MSNSSTGYIRTIISHTALCLIAFILILIPLSANSEDSENMLYNADFSLLDSEGVPEGWYPDAWIQDAGYTAYSVITDETSPTGGNVLKINNIVSNDARMVQTIDVEPDSLYRFSAWIKAEGIEGGHGANLSVEGLYCFSEGVYDTNGEWKQIFWYGVTGEEQHDVTLFLRVGGYSGESAGKAMFCGVEVVPVDEIPGDLIADPWYYEPTYDDWDEEDLAENEPVSAGPCLLIIGLVYILFFLWILFRISPDNQADLNSKRNKMQTAAVVVGLSIALVFRMVLSYFILGYSVDVNCFLSWGSTMLQWGPVSFYSSTSFCDYPPAYTYILGLNAAVSKGISAGNEGIVRVVFRFIPCLCDVLNCLFIYLWAEKKYDQCNRNLLVLFTLLFAFNPVTIINSAAWGQMDSVLCLALFAVAVLASERKWILALPCYMLAVLIKPQALMLGFLGLAAILLSWIREPETRKNILLGLAMSLAVFAVLVIPFSINQPFGWLTDLYARTLGSYPYATVNTANLYYILSGNWSSVTSQGSVWAPILLALFSIGYGTYWFIRTESCGVRAKSAELTVCGLLTVWFVVCAIIGASWSWTGIGAMVFAFVIVLSLFIRKGDIRYLSFFGALLFVLLYVFGIKMHERYIFPAFVLFAVSFAILRDRRILVLLAGFTLTVFLNEGIVLDNSIRLGSSLGHLNQDNIGVGVVLSVLNIILSLYGVHVGTDLLLGNEQILPSEHSQRTVLSSDKTEDRYCTDSHLHWKTADSILLACIVAIYSFVSFSTLGSTKAPQTAWNSSSYEENVVIDLGKQYEDFRMLYFARVSRYDFSVATSGDGINWSDETYAEMAQGQCWKWKYVTKSRTDDGVTRTYDSSGNLDGTAIFSGRYVRITAHQVGLSLCEVLFRDQEGNVLPATVIEQNEANPESEVYSDASALTDEQNTLEGLPVIFGGEESSDEIPQPSWWNSTYFDEIYHARTAYEFLNSSVPYETSHPPLGKILMSWGIAIFGMTPFGWRFAGALAGVLMLVGIYLIGKQLTKKTWAAVLACILMALDCMHLTQTQIATIDSFPVLFIIFSYFFMLRFLQTDVMNAPWKRLLTDLGLCGLFMGLAIASKWIGIYAGAGLAVLYFWHCGRTFAHEKRVNREKENGRITCKKNAGKEENPVLRKLFFLCGWCVVFFVLIPIAIYLLSYIPYFAYNKSLHTIGDYLKAVWNSQTGMFNYHSTPGLGMDHPFYSPWNEWPVNGKPMFYATKQYLTGNLKYSIFCFGNPAVWYPALLAVAGCFCYWIRERFNRLENNRIAVRLTNPGADIRIGFLLIGLLAQYLPWVLVPRGTYIYHYFASTPFLILAIVILLNRLDEKHPKIAKLTGAVWTLAALAFFGLLFPYASGIFASTEWLDIGKSLLRIWY